MASGSLARKNAKVFQEKLSNVEEIKTKKDIREQKKIEHEYMFKTLMENWLINKKMDWGEVTYNKAVKSIEKTYLSAIWRT